MDKVLVISTYILVVIYLNELFFFSDESLTGEALIAQLQERLQELRDIYHSVRSEQAQLDRRWRKTNEKRSNDCL